MQRKYLHRRALLGVAVCSLAGCMPGGADRNAGRTANVAAARASNTVPDSASGGEEGWTSTTPAGLQIASFDAPSTDDPFVSHYDPNSVFSTSGPILGKTRVNLPRGEKGLLLRVKVEGEIPYVYCGPEKWLSQQGFSPNVTDNLSVTGSRVRLNNQNVILAQRVQWYGSTYELLDAGGNPNWPGGRYKKP